MASFVGPNHGDETPASASTPSSRRRKPIGGAVRCPTSVRVSSRRGRMLQGAWCFAACLVASVPATTRADPATAGSADVQPSDEVERIAEDYVRLVDGGSDASGLPDPSPAALDARHESEDRLIARLESLPGPTSPLRDALHWRLDTSRALRACRTELWDVDHINGWQVIVPHRIANLRPGSDRAQQAALAQAAAFGAHVDADIVNLGRGLSTGYSAPRSVVRRVVMELDALLALPAERSPLLRPADAAEDSAFAARWRAVVGDVLLPAFRRYRTYLATTYLPRARRAIGVSSLPDGEACYAAHLRRATTLAWTPAQAYRLGEVTAAAARRELIAIGRRRYDVADPARILARAKADPGNRFGSASALLAFSTRAVERTSAMSAPLFLHMPAQPVVVEPLPDYQQRAGIPSHYEAEPDASKPATYRIALADWADVSVGAAQVTASHETIPGHHLQIATARALDVGGRFAEIRDNTAYVEGWANYAERLAEESGIYVGDGAPIFRRAVLGRSLVVDPGIHVFGWSRRRALAYLGEAGLSRRAAEDAVDRIAVQPAQFTSYESGGLEILQLREEARRRLGDRFDLARFHQRVLERGVVTLDDLSDYVKAWTGD